MKQFIILLILIILCSCNNHKNIIINDDDIFTIKVDYSIPSGKYRFFIYQNNKLIESSLCCHGKGGKSTIKTPEFSNKPGSKCSCLGKFDVEKKMIHTSKGIEAFALQGLNKTNNNAKHRGIFIHPGIKISHQIYPFYLPLCNLSEGCFTISNSTFNTLKYICKNSKTPIQLEAIY